MDAVVAAGHRLEVAWHGPTPSDRSPTLVLLHEGLGSVSTWGDWPAELARRTGLSVLVYSRLGYGKSDPVPLPRPLTYMQHEGERVVPAVLDACNLQSAILLGHSDGGSIALVAAATDRRITGVVTLAAHVFCEDISVASIEKARVAYETTDLRARLLRHHGTNVDGAFWGWNRAWLDPGFRSWNIEPYLPQITAPVLVIQGESDPYGTLAQVDAIVRSVKGPAERLVLPACGHAPQRDAHDATTEAVVAFVDRVAAR